MMSIHTIWYAAFIDNPEKKGNPNALFSVEQDALQWAFDQSLYHADVVPVEIKELSLAQPQPQQQGPPPGGGRAQ